MQIRVRLTLQFLMIVAGILLGVFFIIKFQFKKNLEEEYAKRLRWNAYMIAEMVLGNKSSEQEFKLEYPLDFSGTLAGYYPENVNIYTPEGKSLYTYDKALDTISAASVQETMAAGEYRFAHGKFLALGIVYTNNAGKKFIIIVESYFDRVYMENLTQILSLVFLLTITLVAIGGWFFARQALAPVSRIMNQVDALLPTDMSQRLEPTNQYDELSRLVITFNKLLDRIQHVFRIQKMFLSNVSHELKNPLNVIISQVEVTLNKDRTTEEYKSTLHSILSDVKDLNAIGDKLMQLARINAADAAIPFGNIRIDEVIWEAKEGLMKNHQDYRINFEVVNLPDDEEELFVNGNEPLLKSALTNLMDNGCKFSPDKTVSVKLACAADGTKRIEISDKGPGIPEEELQMVFNAFYRSPRTSSVRGSGIGLSLVESILKLHLIDVHLESKTGEGTTFILLFPAGIINTETPQVNS